MRFMVMVYPGPKYEDEVKPTDGVSNEQLVAMGAFNEELVKAGVMLAGEGLHPPRKGFRVRFDGGKATISDGPFAEAKEVVGGFWLWQVRSREEALAWAQRCPMGDDEMIELRQVYESEDFASDYPDAFTPDLLEAELKLRDELAQRQQA